MRLVAQGGEAGMKKWVTLAVAPSEVPVPQAGQLQKSQHPEVERGLGMEK